MLLNSKTDRVKKSPKKYSWSMKDKLSILYSFILSRIKNIPCKLNFAITYKCNSKCLTCEVWKKYQMDPELSKNELSISEITPFFKKLPSHLTWLSLTGGEPFLREDLVEIVRSAIENISSLNLISIPTNGLAAGQILKNLKEILKNKHPFIYLSFSLDGPPEIHDKIRGVKNAYQRTWDTYVSVKELTKNYDRCSVSVEATISKNNIDYLPILLKELKQQSHKIFVTIAHKAYLYGNENINASDFMLIDNLHNIKEILKTVSCNLSWFNCEELLKKLYLIGVPIYLKDTTKPVLPCMALKSSFSLNSFGEVLPCLMWGKVLGNIRNYDYDVTRIFSLKETKEVLRIIKDSECPNCWTPCEAFQTIIQRFLRLKIL